MAIINVTPDSFSDGGEYLVPEAAVQRASDSIAAGADILDVGGESTRPGSDPVGDEEQIRRVVPVIKAIRNELANSPLISIDTRSAVVAEAALVAGADIINDVSAGRDDPRMFSLASLYFAPLVLMHMQGTPKDMQDAPHYRDVVSDVLAFFKERMEAARGQGLSSEQLILDPGIGFGKRRVDNIALLAHLDRFNKLGPALLLGTSRKRFMGSICRNAAPFELLGATAATTALGVAKGARIFRVHDVALNRQAADVAAVVSGIMGFPSA